MALTWESREKVELLVPHMCHFTENRNQIKTKREEHMEKPADKDWRCPSLKLLHTPIHPIPNGK